MDNPVFDVGIRKYLLFDDNLIERKTGFTLAMNPALRAEVPVLRAEKPWEIGGLCGDSMASVMDDGGVYKLWYSVELLDARKEQVAEIAKQGVLDPKTLADLRSAGQRFALCYAVSADGINWEKPELGILPCQGSAQNNLCFTGRLACTVFKDPAALADARFKMIYGGGPSLPHVHLVEKVPVQNIYHGIYGATSPDGYHWNPHPTPILPWYTDTTNVAYWDDRIRKYVAFVRSNEGMIFQDGKTVTPDKGFRLRYRAIGRSESTDFFNFPPPQRIMEPTLKERRNYKQGVDYYNSSALKYPFATDSYFMFSSNFYHVPDTLDVHLCTSRDGVNYVRWPMPFLGLGPEGAFDSRSIYMVTGIIRRGDWLYMYYVGYDSSHGAGTKKPFKNGIGMVRIRLDGFVSQDARPTGGQLSTVPLQFSGNRLEVNMDANAGGCLKVEILDEHDKPLPGFSRDQADWLWGNDLAKTVTWKGNSDVSAIRDRPVRLDFIGKAVKLYAFQFQSGRIKATPVSGPG